MAVPAGVDKTRCGVDQQAQPAEAGLAFQPGDQVIWKCDSLGSRAQNELSGMENEGLAVGDLDQLRQVLLLLLDVYNLDGVVAEEPEVPVDMEVYRRWLDTTVAQRFDHNAASQQFLSDGAV